MLSLYRTRIPRLRRTLAAFAAAFLATSMPLSAQPLIRGAPSSISSPTGSMSIAGVVNEDVITFYDVRSRVALFIATSGIEPTPDIQRRLVPQVMQALIDERLKLQEAKRLEIEISDADIRQAVTGVEQRNGMKPGAFRELLTEHDIDMGAFHNQIEAEIAWSQVVQGDLRREVAVAPEEVSTVLNRLKANQGKPESLVAEIFLPVTAGVSDGDVRQVAERLIQRARSGTRFPALAQQFSQSPTAALGGDLGWVLPGDLEPPVEFAVASMEPSEISEPVRTNTGYHIIALRARRESGAADPFMAAVTMSQIYLPTIGGRAPSPARIAQLSDAISTQVSSCRQMNSWAEQIGGPGSGPIEPMYVGGLPDQVRDAVVDLPADRVSQPINLPGGRVFVMICERIDHSGLPSEDQIYAKLEGDKLENVARQRLRDLRRQALIDIRL